MLDTIRVSILDFTNDKISKENGWDTTKKGLIYDYKKIKLANKASIFMSYYYQLNDLLEEYCDFLDVEVKDVEYV